MKKEIMEILTNKGLQVIPEEENSFLIIGDQKKQIEELKETLSPLKNYCSVIPMKEIKGKTLDEVENKRELTDLTDIENIPESNPNFRLSDWALRTYGDLVPLPNSLILDKEVNIIDFIGNSFAKKAVVTENKKILELMKTANVVAGTSYEDIIRILKEELESLMTEKAVIITNQDGFEYLDMALDTNNKKILTRSVEKDGLKLFRGKQEVKEISNKDLPNDETGAIPFFIGSIYDFIRFYDKDQYQLDVSHSTGFNINATYLRIFEMFDVRKSDSSAIKFLKVKLK